MGFRVGCQGGRKGCRVEGSGSRDLGSRDWGGVIWSGHVSPRASIGAHAGDLCPPGPRTTTLAASHSASMTPLPLPTTTRDRRTGIQRRDESFPGPGRCGLDWTAPMPVARSNIPCPCPQMPTAPHGHTSRPRRGTQRPRAYPPRHLPPVPPPSLPALPHPRVIRHASSSFSSPAPAIRSAPACMISLGEEPLSEPAEPCRSGPVWWDAAWGQETLGRWTLGCWDVGLGPPAALGLGVPQPGTRYTPATLFSAPAESALAPGIVVTRGYSPTRVAHRPGCHSRPGRQSTKPSHEGNVSRHGSEERAAPSSSLCCHRHCQAITAAPAYEARREPPGV